jgi:iron complex transport system ATP-binding protein
VIDRATVGYAKSGREVLTDVSAVLNPGELACLIGRNGSGKSTLLRTLGRFQPLLGGSVSISGRPIENYSSRGLAQKVAVVLTERIAPGQMRAYDVVALGRYPYTGMAGWLSAADHAVIDRALRATGASELRERSVGELSDGERQRVMIARALAQEPDILLLDEPSAFLDVRGKLELTSMLTALIREHDLAVLMSTHDLEQMMRHADNIWLIDAAGRFNVGAPEDLGRTGLIEQAVGGGASFDPVSGTFSTVRAMRGDVHVDVEGPMRAWTIRAVERAGFTATHQGSTRIHLADGDHTGWNIQSSAGSASASSLGEVVQRLRSLEGPQVRSQVHTSGD